MSDFEQVQIQPDQFRVIESRLNALRANLQIVTERLGPVDKDKSIQQTLETELSNINESIIAGFALVAEAISKGLPPPPGPPAKVGFVKFVFPGLKESE
jgi:hypothetical protein